VGEALKPAAAVPVSAKPATALMRHVEFFDKDKERIVPQDETAGGDK
jgi:hypothetical protein